MPLRAEGLAIAALAVAVVGLAGVVLLFIRGRKRELQYPTSAGSGGHRGELGLVRHRIQMTIGRINGRVASRFVAYPTYLAATLSGASLRQLQYWREQEIFGPELERSGGRVFYSFRDVMALRTFVYLREAQSLHKIRTAIGTLRELGNLEHLSNYVLVGDGDRIAFVESDDSMIDLTKNPGQGVMAFMRRVFEPFVNRQGAKVVDLLRPTERVAVDPELLGGYPVIAGTRIEFDLVASLVDDGVEPGDIKDFYPSVGPKAARDAVTLARLVEDYRSGRMPSAA